MATGASEVAGLLVETFEAAVLEFSRSANPGSEQEHRAHDAAKDALETARANLLDALLDSY